MVNAVRYGKFHIYAVSTIDEGIEALTGVEAGEPDENGKYPDGTVHALVERRLSEMSRSAQRRDREPSEPDSGDESGR